MLTKLDRVQVVATDTDAAVATYVALFGAEVCGSGTSALLAANRTELQVGDSIVEILTPTGDGPVADFAANWREGLFGVGFSTPDLQTMARHFDGVGAAYREEGDGLLLDSATTRGIPTVITRDEQRAPVGHMRHIYEVTNPVGDWREATGWYALLFGLDASRFSRITSHQFGYDGMLTLFDPPAKLDRIEVTQTDGAGGAMDRFYQRRGNSLYMCYCETDDVEALAGRLREHTGRFAYSDRDPSVGLFVHPTALHGMLMGVSRTNYAWTWSGRPHLAGSTAPTSH